MELLNVKKIRKERGLTQEALATECGVSIRTVQNWEKGSVIPEVAKKLIVQMSQKPATASPLVGNIPPRHRAVRVPKRAAINSLSMARAGSTMQVTANGDGTVTIQKIDTPIPNAIPVHSLEANIDTGVVTEKDPEPIPATAEVIPIVPSEIASCSGVDIKRYIEENESELKKLSPSDLTGDVDGLEEIQKNSMWPALAPGDKVFLKFLKHKTHIVDGEFYYFNLKDRPTMIRQVSIEGDKLRLIALNPQFCDIITDFDNVLRVANVKGMYREFIGSQYSEVEAIRKKKDSQIDKLIDQNSKALESISDLIEVIKDRG